jgi:alpha-ribazole phosphatase/probable phosphoglycerate mutase
VRLLLARHGQSLWNEVRRFQGTTDVALSALGRRQAEALGRAVRGRRLAAAYVSPMQRAFETATIALEGTGVPIVPLDELRELSLGEWEGCTVDEISGREGDPYRRWLEAPHDCPPPGAEALPDVCFRMLRAIDRIAAGSMDWEPRNGFRSLLDSGPGGDVLIVAHGGIISVYLCHLLGCSFNTLWRLRVDNASLTTVEPPRIVTLNDTAHLVGGQRSGSPGEAGALHEGRGVGKLRPPRDGPSA